MSFLAKHYVHIAITSVVVAALFAGIATGIATERERAFFSEELAGTIPLPVTVNGNTYTVDGGSVTSDGQPALAHAARIARRTAWYVTLTRRNPIFGIDGTDPEKLKQVVDELSASIESYVSFYDKDEQDILREHFYPIEFLNELSVLEKRRRNLLAKPSPEEITAYHVQIMKTLGAYKKEAMELAKTTEDTSLESDHDALAFLDGYTTVEQFGEYLDALVMRSEVARTSTESRYACFAGDLKTCDENRNNSVNMSLTGNHATDAAHHLPFIIQKNKKFLADYRTALNESQANKSNAFVMVREPDPCFPDNSEPAYFDMRWVAGTTGAANFRIEYINAVYGYNVSAADTPYLSSLAQSGITFLYQPVTPYLCPSITHELPFVRTIAYIRTNLVNKSLFASATSTDPVIATAAEIEKHLTATDIVFDADLDRYMSLVDTLLSVRGETGLAEVIGKLQTRRAQHLVNAYHQKSAALDESMRSLMSINNIIANFNKRGWKPSIRFLLLARSYPMFYFLGHNASVVGESAPTITTPRQTDLENFRLVELINWDTMSPAQAQTLLRTLVEGRQREYGD